MPLGSRRTSSVPKIFLTARFCLVCKDLTQYARFRRAACTLCLCRRMSLALIFHFMQLEGAGCGKPPRLFWSANPKPLACAFQSQALSFISPNRREPNFKIDGGSYRRRVLTFHE